MAAENTNHCPVVVVLDVETTGLKDDDKVVQIACLKVDKNGTKTAWTRFINPEMETERQRAAEKLHGISPESLLDKPTFEQIVENFLEFLDDVDVMVSHNALFDWSMLWNEFKRMKHPKAQDFAEKFQWLDVLRLSILHYQSSKERFKPMDYRLVTLKDTMNVNTELLATELCSCIDNGGDTWRHGQHDAMYDVFTTYGVLRYCMQQMDFDGLLQKHPKALLDTSLFIEMQKLRDENRTRDLDLMPFANRAKEYFTTARPRGKVLKELRKDYLYRMTEYHEEDYRTDRRIVLIYQAAYLDPPCALPAASMLQKEHTEQSNQHDTSDQTPILADEIKDMASQEGVTQHDPGFEAVIIDHENVSVHSISKRTAIKVKTSIGKAGVKELTNKKDDQATQQTAPQDAINASTNTDEVETKSEIQVISEEKVTSPTKEPPQEAFKEDVPSCSIVSEKSDVQKGRDTTQNEDKDITTVDKLEENIDVRVGDSSAQNNEKDQNIMEEGTSPPKKMKMTDISG